MSLHFKPADTRRFGSFLSVGCGSGGLAAAAAAGYSPGLRRPQAQPPERLNTAQLEISQNVVGFSDWKQESIGIGALDLDRPVSEFRWCYYGGNSNPGNLDVGRIDRLEVFEGSRIGFVLPDPKPGSCHCRRHDCSDCCQQVNSQWKPAARSRSVWSPREAAVCSIPMVPMRFADESTPGRIVLEFPLTGDGTTLEYMLMLLTRDDDRLATTGTIRLSLPAPPLDAGYRVTDPSSSYLIAVKDNGRLMGEYCTALNMSAALCDRVFRHRLCGKRARRTPLGPQSCAVAGCGAW